MCFKQEMKDWVEKDPIRCHWHIEPYSVVEGRIVANIQYYHSPRDSTISHVISTPNSAKLRLGKLR